MEPIRRVAFCPHCNNRAPQTLIHSQTFEDKGYGVSDDTEGFIPSIYHVDSCDTCNEILVYLDFGEQFGAEHFEDSDLAWPQKKTLSKSVPRDVNRIYEEAASIRSKSPDAFAVQIRRGLEAICINRGVKEENLARALKELADKGEIPPILSEMSDVLRLLGNVGAHWTGQRVHPLQTRALDEFFMAIVEYIYIAPSKLKEFREQLAEFEKHREVNKEEN
jgi:hypothetical protein